MQTILIVEDEIPISQVLKAYLQKANIKMAAYMESYGGEESFIHYLILEASEIETALFDQMLEVEYTAWLNEKFEEYQIEYFLEG